jgi:hypothetical protein
MTDRELLENAAKAAGIRLRRYEAETANITAYFVIEVTKDTHGDIWNPLTDDGDALRLAVKLQLEPRFLDMDHPAGPPRVTFHNVPGLIVFVREDPYAATRRAIVRAAAEIGRNMP